MMASVIAGIQVEFGLRNVLEPDARAESRGVELRIHPTFRLEEMRIPVSSDCPFHEGKRALVPVSGPESTFEELMNRERADAVLLDWPICVQARCLDCTAEWAPMLRLAVLRRKGKCPACGSANLLELQSLQAVTRDSAWVQRTPSELQLPANHLYNLQPRQNPQ
jgi:hypothetical protein